MRGEKDYADEAHRLSREAFVEAYPCPFLLRYLDKERELGTPGFNTDTFQGDEIRSALLDPALRARLKARRSFKAYPLVKSGLNPWRRRISVGRARNNDVALAGAPVSKVHVHFHLGDGGFSISDAGSKNGTWLNNEKVQEHEQRTVVFGDHILLAPYTTLELLEPGDLHDRLRGL